MRSSGFPSGNYSGSGALAEEALVEAYRRALDLLGPYVEAGFANPRNSSVPMTILNKINNAARGIDAGRMMEGRRHLLSALGDWREIPELRALEALTLLLCACAGMRVRIRGR